jgi:fructose-1,6-bisphosphatase/inositol monophosphatase family enzyme
MTGLDWLERIRQVHERTRAAVVDACTRQAPDLLAAVTEDSTGKDGDTIFAIDKLGEQAFVASFAQLAGEEPVCLIAEGLEGGRLVLPSGAAERDCRWRVLADPIDGTRGLMYQKRSAWILTGVAPNRGAGTRLSDIELAVQTEIPLVKQHLCDQLWATRGQGTQARRLDRLSGATSPLWLRPSGAGTLAQGFATVVRFFPGAREILGAIDDEVIGALAPDSPGRAGCFEDQYASSGGELYELIAGHDRFVADLRPLVQSVRAARGLPSGLCCHPYDLCTALIAEEAGVTLTDAAAAPLDAPLGLDADVAWVGYANQALRALIEPRLQAALRRRGLVPAAGM